MGVEGIKGDSLGEENGRITTDSNKQKNERKEKKNKIVQVPNIIPVPTLIFPSLSVTHATRRNFYFSADWIVYGVSSLQKYTNLHRTRKQSSQKC